MPWFKVDDSLHSHPKWIAASPHARALWVTAGSWCAAHLTDGHVPKHMLTLFGARPKDAAELVRLGLWVEADDEPEGGWRFHDWDQYQPSAASVMAERAAARERQRRARERAKQARESRGMSRRDARRDSPMNDTVSHGPPDPTRPDEENKSSSNSRRGAGTPDDDEGTSQLNPTVGAAVAVLARRDLEQRQTAPDQPPVADPTAWERRAYQRRLEAHRRKLEQLLAQEPSLTAEELADRIQPPLNGHPATNGHSDPLAGIQAAARARAERHLRVIHGQACTACNDTGWRLDPDSNEAVPCIHQTAQEAR
jgi:hypothetical protein